MKLSFLKYRTSLLLKKNKTPRSSTPLKSARSIGVIFTVEDKQKHFAIKEFIKKMEVDGRSVQVLEFLPKDTENYEFKFDFFMEKDINFWGNVESDSALQFCEKPFDYLFYLDLNPNPLILHMVARSRARCRVGHHWEGSEKYLDLMIHSEKNTPALLDNIHKYISNLV